MEGSSLVCLLLRRRRLLHLRWLGTNNCFKWSDTHSPRSNIPSRWVSNQPFTEHWNPSCRNQSLCRYRYGSVAFMLWFPSSMICRYSIWWTPRDWLVSPVWQFLCVCHPNFFLQHKANQWNRSHHHVLEFVPIHPRGRDLYPSSFASLHACVNSGVCLMRKPNR